MPGKISAIERKTPLLLVPVYYALYFLFNPPDWMFGDAKNVFSKVSVSSWYFGIQRYSLWSSRLWIEGATVFAVHHVILFQIISLLCIGLLCYSISSMLDFAGYAENIVLATLIIALFPAGSLSTAGWIATTVNYLWPITLFACWLNIAVKYNLKRTGLLEQSIGLLSLLMSIFSEIMTIAALGFLLMQFLYYKRKFFTYFRLLSVVLAVIGLINVIVCPGNATRKASEITRWFPQYEHFSLPDKVLIQISHLGVYITSTYGSLHVVFGLCILAGAIMGRKLTPMILTSLSTAITGFNAPVLQSRLQEVAALISAKKLTQDDLTRLYWPMALFVTCLLMLIVAIVLTYGTSMVSLTILGSTGLSAILFLTVSESPTLLASVDRPLVPFYIAVIASCSLMINQMANYFMAKGKDVPEEFTQESGSPHTKTRCGN